MIDEEGFGEQTTGYGGQLKNTDRVSISEYRDERGNKKRLTEFNFLDVTHPSPAVFGLLNERMSDLNAWYVPVSPDSKTPLPVLVETKIELQRARALLAEFRPSPPVLASSEGKPINKETPPESLNRLPNNEKSGSAPTETQLNISEGSSSPPQDDASSESSDLPVEDVRGVSSMVADALSEAGYKTRADLKAASDQELAAIDGLSEQQVTVIRAVVGSQ
ncbi:hypothetical protein [Halovenus amylolytica]|uniref:hypothetical protein n=1 Tax=Halovenus amylolytica TaxID=2500550 RepID=UPI003D6A687E